MMKTQGIFVSLERHGGITLLVYSVRNTYLKSTLEFETSSFEFGIGCMKWGENENWGTWFANWSSAFNVSYQEGEAP